MCRYNVYAQQSQDVSMCTFLSPLYFLGSIDFRAYFRIEFKDIDTGCVMVFVKQKTWINKCEQEIIWKIYIGPCYMCRSKTSLKRPCNWVLLKVKNIFFRPLNVELCTMSFGNDYTWFDSNDETYCKGAFYQHERKVLRKRRQFILLNK